MTTATLGHQDWRLRRDISEAAEETDLLPSPEQKAAGNYRKGKFVWNGLTIAIENPRGSMRSGTDSDGNPWSVQIRNHYGAILRTESEADGDHIDVFVGDHPESRVVYVVDQLKQDGSFDEHKVVIGCDTAAEARSTYLANYKPGWRGFGAITGMDLPVFKDWVKNGDTSKPLHHEFSLLTGRMLDRNADMKAATVATGKAIAEKIVESARDELIGLTHQLIDRDLSLAAWQRQAAQVLKELHLRAGLAGWAGWNGRTTGNVHDYIHGRVMGQIVYLFRLAGDIERGDQEKDDSLLTRISMYADAGRHTYQGALRRSQSMPYERRVLGETDKHCDECLDYAAKSWQPAGTLPDIGDCQCLCITTPWSRVLTKRGWVAIDSVKAGDFVLTHRLRWRRVLETILNHSSQHHRLAIVQSRTGAIVGCTSDHRWMTEEGWKTASCTGNCELPVYDMWNEEKLLAMWCGFGRSDERESMPHMRQRVLMRRIQRLPCSRLSVLLKQPDCSAAVADYARENDERFGSRRQEEKGEVREFDGGGLQPDQDGWESVCEVLERAREALSHLPLPVAMDQSQRANSERNADSPQRRQPEQRLSGQPGDGDESATSPKAPCAVGMRPAWVRSRESPPRLDLPELWDKFQILLDQRPSCSKVLFSGLPLPVKTFIYDLNVDEDHSFIIEGMIAHNSNCLCEFEFSDKLEPEEGSGPPEPEIVAPGAKKHGLAGKAWQAVKTWLGFSEAELDYLAAGVADFSIGTRLAELRPGRGLPYPLTSDSFEYYSRLTGPANAEFQEPDQQQVGIIEVPDIVQPNRFGCGAAASMCVGRYFGVGPEKFGEWEKALGTTVEKSTSPQAIVEYLSSLGLRVVARWNMEIDDLAACWKAGMPVICPVQDYGAAVPAKALWNYGHYLTVIGLVPGKPGYVACQDSSEQNIIRGQGSVQAPGRILIAADKWLEIWHDRDVEGKKYVRYGIAVGKPA